MTEWWDGLDSLLKALYCIAIPSTLLFVIQTIQVMLGFGEGGEGFNPTDTSGMDLPDAGDMSANSADLAHDATLAEFGDLRLFTLQGFVALFTVFGWSSISFVKSGLNPFLAILIGVALGALAMYLVAKVIMLSRKIVSSGNIDLKNALGMTGNVYIPIGPKGSNPGKITLTIQDRFMEFDAVNDGGEPLASGQMVRVIDIQNGILIVEKGEH